jgi:uncharacterized protein (TIGR04168 family)
LESTQRITESVAKAAYENIIFLGHNGPCGLGSEEHSICGRDWKIGGGDYGDPDFAEALFQSYQMQKRVPLATFGHMHHHLRLNSHRTRDAIATNNLGTIFLNAACSPRIVKNNDGEYRNFSIVNLESGQISQISLVWLNSQYQIVNENILFQQIL